MNYDRFQNEGPPFLTSYYYSHFFVKIDSEKNVANFLGGLFKIK